MDNNESKRLLEKTPQRSRISTFKGILAAACCALFVAVSAICVQGLNRAIPDFELNTLRSGFAWLGTVVACISLKISPKVTGKNIIATGLFAFFLVTEALTVYISVTFIPLAAQQAIFNTTNLCMALIFLWIFVSEKPALFKVIAVILCVIGVVLVLQPNFIFANSALVNDVKTLRKNTSKIETTTCTSVFNEILLDNDAVDRDETIEEYKATETIEEEAETSDPRWLKHLGHGLSFVQGLAFAAHVTTVRHYSEFFGHFRNQVITLFWTFLLGTVVSFVPMLIFEHAVLPYSIIEYLLCVGHILANFFIVPCDVYACATVDGNTVSILQSTRIVYMALAQYTIMKDLFPGHRNWIEIFGIVLIILGSILSSIVQLVKSGKSEKDQNKENELALNCKTLSK